ncbi:hypothetical protein TNCV_2422841 [Trichonephila clavipes]|nr:hypothetical protein TNCV_2422841 [Trichonephila clavipes]
MPECIILLDLGAIGQEMPDVARSLRNLPQVQDSINTRLPRPPDSTKLNIMHSGDARMYNIARSWCNWPGDARCCQIFAQIATSP